MIIQAFNIIIAWVLDRLLGDPATLPHPIVYFGKAIAWFEHRLNKGAWRRAKGAFTAITLVALTFVATWALLKGADIAEQKIAETIGFDDSLHVLNSMLSIILIFYCLAGTTLIREVRWVFEALDRSLDEGRKQVARIVGRDTSELSAQEVRTAALETLAENLSDGVIAPLFWLALLGVPGMMAYKMVNTLDSMIGYHTERYLRFGMVAARIDDITNYIPARLTALLMILSAGKPQLISFVWRYGKQHASPNSGYPEAALAGILQCRFGGPHHYFGEYFYKPYIGNNDRELATADMLRAVSINKWSECLMIMIVLTILFLCK